MTQNKQTGVVLTRPDNQCYRPDTNTSPYMLQVSPPPHSAKRRISLQCVRINEKRYPSFIIQMLLLEKNQCMTCMSIKWMNR